MTLLDCSKTHDNENDINAETVIAESIIAEDITATDFVSLANGTNSTPSLRFTSDPDTGLYYGTNSFNIAIQSVPVSSFDLNTGFITNLIPLAGPTGTAGVPAFTFQADTDSGIYRENANQIAVTTGGINRLSLSATGMQYGVNSYAPTGMTGTPSMSFSNDPTSGLYYDTSENCIGISHSSQKKVSISPTGTNFYDNNVLTGSVLSNGFNSSSHEVLFVEGTSQTFNSGTEATFTNYSTPTLNRGFATISSGVITIPSDGLYHIVVFATYGSNVNGYRNLRITNSSGIMTTNRTLQATNDDPGAGCRLCHTFHYNASSGDTLAVVLLQTSGISLGAFVSGLSIVRLF